MNGRILKNGEKKNYYVTNTNTKNAKLNNGSGSNYMNKLRVREKDGG